MSPECDQASGVHVDPDSVEASGRPIDERASQGLSHEDKAAREWLTVQEAADLLSVSKDTIQRLIGSGQLESAAITTQEGKGFKKRHRIRREWLEDYLLSTTMQQENTGGTSRKKRTDVVHDFID